jgi:uncharacterized protein YggE
MQSFFNLKANQILGSLVLLLIIFALGAYSQYTFKQAEYLNMGPATVSVTGEGEVMAVPDIGQFSFSVTAKGEDASTAQETSAEKINAIFALLEEEEVEEKDIKTEGYNLYPKYRYEQKSCPVGSRCPNEQVEDGFEVTQRVQVKIRDVDEAGALIAGVGDLGATNISSLQFTIDDTDELSEEARALAIDDAKEKAKVLAKDLGVKLVRIVSYHENGGGVNPYAFGGDMMEKSMSLASFDDSSADLPVGENTIRSVVSITYQVR